MKPCFFALVLTLFLPLAGTLPGAAAQPATSAVTSLMPPREPVAPQSVVAIDWVALNPGAGAVRFDPPPTLSATLRVGDQSWPVQLLSTQMPQASILPGGFAVKSFTFALPSGAIGQAVLEVPGEEHSPPLRTVVIISGEAAPSSAPPPAPLTNFALNKPAASALERSFAGRLSAHESIYFLYGAKEPAAKFQFSFKYRILSMGKEGVPQTLQFAYTQRSLWDIEGPSSPFFDTSYMPELLFESLAPTPKSTSRWFTWLGYQAGYKHESNGRDGPLSRSINTLNARAAFVLGRMDRWAALVIPEVFGYVSDLSNNRDIADYRGYGQLRMVMGRNDGAVLMFAGRTGRDFHRFTYQLDLTVPFRTRLLEFETYFILQYFNGYGESLRTYWQKSDAARIGVSLVR